MTSLKNKRVAVIGIGVSNTPLIRMLLSAGINVTACDKNSRDGLGEISEELERLGAHLQLGENYLAGLDQDVIFRTPGLRPMFRHWRRPGSAERRSPQKWKSSSGSAPARLLL